MPLTGVVPPHVPAPVGLDLLARLRAETRVQHDAIEQVVDLTGAGLTRAGYRRRIEQFYGFYRPLEDRMLRAGHGIAPWLDFRERLKTPLLEEDLRALGDDAPGLLATCRELPGLDGPAELFGCLYVLEGSTMGGQLISRHIRQTLGVTPDAGGRFFNGYGTGTGPMWQQFRAALTRYSTATDTQDRVVAAARGTFDALRVWCLRGRA